MLVKKDEIIIEVNNYEEENEGNYLWLDEKLSFDENEELRKKRFLSWENGIRKMKKKWMMRKII
jgi:succinyl-CoA synthetase beta subunit